MPAAIQQTYTRECFKTVFVPALKSVALGSFWDSSTTTLFNVIWQF